MKLFLNKDAKKLIKKLRKNHEDLALELMVVKDYDQLNLILDHLIRRGVSWSGAPGFETEVNHAHT